MAFEAAYGWGWLVELLEDYGFDAHLVHQLRCKAIASARLKNDKVDAAILAQLLRADLRPEAWIAPPQVRQLRALLRHRASLVRLGTQLQNRIHAVAADHGYDRTGKLLDRARPRLAGRARSSPGVAGDHHAEIGDITRFTSARKLASWAGLTPTVRGSDLTVRHGHMWKARLGMAALGPQPGSIDRQTVPGVRRHLRRHRRQARQEDRHHRDRPQAPHPRLPSARRRGRPGTRPGHAGYHRGLHRQRASANREGHQAPGTLAPAA